jgi:hypothetical protein
MCRTRSCAIQEKKNGQAQRGGGFQKEGASRNFIRIFRIFDVLIKW